MAVKNDEVAMLVRCAMEGDIERFRKSVNSIISNCRKKNKIAMANILEQLLNKNSPGSRNNFAMLSNIPKDLQGYIDDVTPQKTFADLVLPGGVEKMCRDIILEHENGDMLRSKGLEPRNRMLLTGPPGNGKTSLSEAIAEAMGMRFYRVNYDAIIGSYLGETSARIAKVFDYISQHKCVILFDEIDILGKARSDGRDVGEMNRIVSTFMLRIDYLPSGVLMIGATNHHDFLDSALWRRFQLKINMPAPDMAAVIDWFNEFQGRSDFVDGIDFGCSCDEFYDRLLELKTRREERLSFSDIEEFWHSALRKYYLSGDEANIESIVRQQLDDLALQEDYHNGQKKL